jgi:uncharacterized protein (UPF0548 family)
MSELTYTEVGATRSEPLPAGYHHLRHRALVGFGAGTFDRAAEAVLTFGMHRAAGVRIGTTADRAAVGVRLTVGLWPFTVPCEVVYTIAEPRRVGFGYGTLPGHQETGEEAFVVEWDDHDRVWLRVTSFSRPARAVAVLAGPVAVLFQRLFAYRLGRALDDLCAPSHTVGP